MSSAVSLRTSRRPVIGQFRSISIFGSIRPAGSDWGVKGVMEIRFSLDACSRTLSFRGSVAFSRQSSFSRPARISARNACESCCRPSPAQWASRRASKSMPARTCLRQRTAGHATMCYGAEALRGWRTPEAAVHPSGRRQTAEYAGSGNAMRMQHRWNPRIPIHSART